MANPKTRLVDIAKDVGVSTATVSRALNGDSYVRRDLAVRIHEAARRLNYRSPQALTGQRVLLITSEEAMLDSTRNQFSQYVIEGLRQRARKLDSQLEILTTDEDPVAELQRQSQRGDIAGALLLSVDDTVLDAARSMPYPMVVVNGDDPLMQLNSVTPCNRSASALATQHLVNLGHRDIAFLAKRGRRTIERRIEGWRDVVRKGQLIEVSDWTSAAAGAALSGFEGKPLPFSALVCAGDTLALGAIKTLSAMGHNVPEDISVIGMDGLPMSEFHSPALTTIMIPMKDVGRKAIDLLCDLIRSNRIGESQPVHRIELACQIAIRETTAAADMRAAEVARKG